MYMCVHMCVYIYIYIGLAVERIDTDKMKVYLGETEEGYIHNLFQKSTKIDNSRYIND